MDSVTLGLPSTVLVGRMMPKKVFYEHLATTAAVREQFVRLIDRIEMVASIKEASLHIPSGEKVSEIDVVGVHLHAEDERVCEVPHDALNLIAKSVPNRLLFVCVAGDAAKLLVRRDRLYETEWLPCGHATVELCGTNLDELWDSLSSQVVFGDCEPSDLMGRVERKSRIEALRRELEEVNRKRRNEKQIHRRNALFDRKRAIEAELSRLEEEL